MTDPYILYGVPASYYTGKARAYMRKQRIDFEERSSAHPAFAKDILPKTGRILIPVLQTPEGEVIQDSDDIIGWFEDRGLYRASAHPAGALQRILSHAFNLFGSEGMTRLAMHYRWSVLGQQEAFIAAGFAHGVAPELSPEAALQMARPVMDKLAGYLPGLGVTPETIPLVEAAYHEMLAILQKHFEKHPCLFGAWPSLGDYGLYGPLFAHLGRDPVPAFEMKTKASAVFRWTERLSAPNLDIPEFPSYRVTGFLPDGEVPATIDAFCRFMADEMLTELADQVAALARWLEANDAAEGAPVVDKPHKRSIGRVETHYRGKPITTGLSPYRMLLLQKLQDAFDALTADEQAKVRDYFAKVGLAPLLTLRPARRVERRGNIEVWGKAA
ncbi:glutathione S-transferase N-terminal domain-containing protein [Gimibacter soli]|uniref:Glutathione S-transferase N-terminal domain-containing protein n=1 Tax=Gimibacter soli TaxID=3024400 RepID=A0AAF0BL88_9PROT|nr:glutathione S-transferase N-terminal domain-containing protein [Gimibacter soli]WCL53852.1 glutathione S-transferase N-terminal domain-containing protein [Gimibacter soli]